MSTPKPKSTKPVKEKEEKKEKDPTQKLNFSGSVKTDQIKL